MKKYIIAIFISLLCSVGFAIDTKSVRYEYVVFVSSLWQFSISSDSMHIGKITIDDSDGQPGWMGRILKSPSTNYYDVFITTNSQAQMTFINNANVKKCCYKVGRAYLDANGNAVYEKLMDYPIDWKYPEVHP